MAANAYFLKEERSKINNIPFHFRKLGKPNPNKQKWKNNKNYSVNF